MLLTRRLRNLGLTAHVSFSVGWFGAVAAFLALSITGIATTDVQVARSCYVAMELIGWYIILPACLASLITGLIQSLGTHWGLYRHYWIVAKFALTIIATIVLLLHMQPITHMGQAALTRP